MDLVGSCAQSVSSEVLGLAPEDSWGARFEMRSLGFQTPPGNVLPLAVSRPGGLGDSQAGGQPARHQQCGFLGGGRSTMCWAEWFDLI